ncbi:phage tail sheath protein [Crassaminicella thermophila]|uniref:Phage tail sheath protein n=1 Tax=Crassaminicella thermophila TaxID=2599308 RepID=A0A5C0SEH2_CRATE|nr:phage tail sheath C-terminal domain-containing protein [Crassaminicella thermophila]QEK11694.1 phage tail sheath protein [Crassaminicella thermophila]
MGLPEILIEFKTQGTTAIQRSARGIVALILKDDTNATFDTKVYTEIDEIDANDWTATNKDYIEKTFLGIPSKVIVERIATAATDYNTALGRLKNKKWNYLAIPGLQTADVTNIATWIKTERDNNKKTFKAVLPNHTGDHEGIINFATDNIKVGETTYTTAEYCCRIAGILAGLPFSRSSTYYALTEVESITESVDPSGDIDAGKLILINDGEKIKIGRGVNSLTTTTATKGEEFKKIKIVEGVDLVRDDIRDTFDSEYVGKVVNIYDNKVLFLAAVNAYFGELERIDVLDSSYDNKAEIDIIAQKLYLQGKGIDINSLKEQEIKEYNTGSKVFAKAQVKFSDAMEDLSFTVFM